MSLVAASCPSCSVSSQVPKEMIGKKVRCKSCKATFIVQPAAFTAVEPRSTRSSSKAGLSSSGAMRRPAKKSNATLWVVLSVVTLLLVGGAGAGVWYTMQEEPVKHAKAKTRRDDASKSAKDDADKKQTKGGKTPIIDEKPDPRPGKKTPAANPKTPPQGEVKMTEPALVAPLVAAMPLELKDLGGIKAILPLGNHPFKLGLHTQVGTQHYFELYDIKKQQLITKVKLEDNADMVSVDPDGTAVAAVNHEKSLNIKRFNIYGLPEGNLVVDEWNPYDNTKDQTRFLGDSKFAQVALLGKNQLWVMTEAGFGDLWELPSKRPVYLIPSHSRDDFLKVSPQANRDFVLSPDGSRFAYATDEGIQLHDAKSGDRKGTTPKLTKYGTKPEILAMGFEPGGTKLAVYFTAGKVEGRPIQQARFSVPSGEELMAAPALDAADTGSVEFINADYLFAVENFERNHAALRDGSGKIVATCNIPGRSSRFAPKVVQAHVAFAFMNEKNQPAIGVVRMPLAGPAVVIAPPPPSTTEATKGKSLSEILTGTPTPEAKTPEPTKERTFDRQEIWEFGAQGIVRKGIKSFEQK